MSSHQAFLKKKGCLYLLYPTKPVQRVLKELNDDKSTLNQALKGINKGKDIAQDIAEQYNKIAEWAALPQDPKLFLREKK